MPPLLSIDETERMDSVNESDDEPMSTEMLQDIRDGSQYHPNNNKREACYKIRNRNKKI